MKAVVKSNKVLKAFAILLSITLVFSIANIVRVSADTTPDAVKKAEQAKAVAQKNYDKAEQNLKDKREKVKTAEKDLEKANEDYAKKRRGGSSCTNESREGK